MTPINMCFGLFEDLSGISEGISSEKYHPKTNFSFPSWQHW